MRVLVVNAGSSSLKLTLLDGEDNTLESLTLAGADELFDGDGDGGVLGEALRSALGEADVVGHRIVHGGEQYRDAVLIDARVEADLRELVELAPLHQPKSLAALDAVTQILPELPRVACFDTAFHRTIPPPAATYALPAQWRQRFGLRRYGFHGLSHAWVARRAPELLGVGDPHTGESPDPEIPDGAQPGERARGLRLVSCHLGAGASLCAIADGASLDTTMGFTPLEGLVMATRSGSVDPGMLLWLLERTELSAREMTDTLEHRSGLLGLAGSADMREILRRAAEGEHTASLALGVYLHRLRGGIAAMAAALGGLDVLAFTGGVGERSAELRAHTCAGLGFLGVSLDESRNRRTNGDGEIGAPAPTTCELDTPSTESDAKQQRVRTVVVTAREDIEIARQVRALGWHTLLDRRSAGVTRSSATDQRRR